MSISLWLLIEACKAESGEGTCIGDARLEKRGEKMASSVGADSCVADKGSSDPIGDWVNGGKHACRSGSVVAMGVMGGDARFELVCSGGGGKEASTRRHREEAASAATSLASSALGQALSFSDEGVGVCGGRFIMAPPLFLLLLPPRAEASDVTMPSDRLNDVFPLEMASAKGAVCSGDNGVDLARGF